MAYLYFHHHANEKRGLKRSGSQKETAQQLGQKREGGRILTQVFGGWAPAPELPPHEGWELSRGSVDCRG